MKSLMQMVPVLLLAIATLVIEFYGPAHQGNLFHSAGGTRTAMLPLAPTTGEPRAAGEGSGTQMLISPLSASASQTVKIVETNGTFAFDPQTLPVSVGTSVTWQNTTSAVHTVTSNNGTFASGNIPPGGIFTFTFTSAGRYDYHCDIHPNMTGTISVQ